MLCQRLLARCRRSIVAPLALLCALLQAGGCRSDVYRYETRTRLGTVRVFAPHRKQSAVVFLFSDSPGWNDMLDRAAAALQVRGAVVVGVDLSVYLAGLAASDDGCHYLLSEIEDISQRIQHDLKHEEYRSPILAGVGQGATLAYAALAQAPAATVDGAVSVDPARVLATRVPLCPGARAIADPGEGFHYAGYASLPGRWSVSATGAAASYWQAVAAASGSTVSLAGTDGPIDARVTKLVEDALPAVTPGDGDRVRKLPLVEYPVKGTAAALLVFFSGDGGWRDLDKQIGEIVARRGIPVVGVDSLRYFWRPRTPGKLADDLAAILRTYGTRWGAPRFFLAGYSFGADILPFAYNRLPAELRDAVVQVSLLGIESTALFEFTLKGWLGHVPGQPVLPELRVLPPRIIQCFYGEDEEDTLCRSPEVASAEIIRTAGSHHFDGDYAALASRILDGMERRLRASALPADDATESSRDEGGDVRQNDRGGEPAR